MTRKLRGKDIPKKLVETDHNAIKRARYFGLQGWGKVVDGNMQLSPEAEVASSRGSVFLADHSGYLWPSGDSWVMATACRELLIQYCGFWPSDWQKRMDAINSICPFDRYDAALVKEKGAIFSRGEENG